MAIPLVIGGLVLGGFLAAALSDDDDSEVDFDDDDDYERVAALRAAERKRTKNEREKQINAAHKNFLSRGESIGLDIANSLQGWAEVTPKKSPAFSAKLTEEGYEVEASAPEEQSILDLLPNTSVPLNETYKNLVTYSRVYAVNLAKGTEMLSVGSELNTINSELEKILKIKKELHKLKSIIPTQK